MSSGVLQGSILGQVLINIFISDQEVNIKSLLVKCAHDTKMVV